MAINKERWSGLLLELRATTLVAVSKTKPAEDIQGLYDLGQRDFGENYVQELLQKQAALPHDIRWHFIGHLQSNKVKDLIPFVCLIQGVDSEKLLKEIHKQAKKANKKVAVLLQVHIAQEETKFGLDEQELETIIHNQSLYDAVSIKGMMGMASNTDDPDKVRGEFRHLHGLFNKYQGKTGGNIQMTILSMGMSGDYKMAVEEGSSMVRIGSLLFGAR